MRRLFAILLLWTFAAHADPVVVVIAPAAPVSAAAPDLSGYALKTDPRLTLASTALQGVPMADAQTDGRMSHLHFQKLSALPTSFFSGSWNDLADKPALLKGDTGAAGATGPAGPASTVPGPTGATGATGPAGPVPTAAQILAAVPVATTTVQGTVKQAATLTTTSSMQVTGTVGTASTVLVALPIALTNVQVNNNLATLQAQGNATQAQLAELIANLKASGVLKP